MHAPYKNMTRIVLGFSMVAILQCCCCILPVRWRVSTAPAMTSAPALTNSNMEPARLGSLGARTVAERTVGASAEGFLSSTIWKACLLSTEFEIAHGWTAELAPFDLEPHGAFAGP